MNHFLEIKFLQNGYFVDSLSGKTIDLNYTMTMLITRQILDDRKCSFTYFFIAMSLMISNNKDLIWIIVAVIITTNMFLNFLL